MKVFMADECQPANVGGRNPRRACGQQGGVQVLEASASLTKHCQEDISLEREETPEGSGLTNDLLQVLRGALTVPLPNLAGVHHVVPRAAYLELVDNQVAGDDR